MDAGHAQGTPKMNWDAPDLVVAWDAFINHVEFWFKGPLAKKSEEEKCNYLMIWSGEKGREIYTTWTLTDEEKKSFTTLTGKFETHVRPKTNKIFSRYKFQCRTQREGETFEQFLTDLHVLARDCAYQEKDNMIRDAIVFGTVDHKVREKCINEGSELTLDAAVNYARTYELSKAQLQKMEKTVNVIKKGKPASTNKAKPTHQSHSNATYNSKGDHSNQNRGKTCSKCARSHPPRNCPAYGKKCMKCGGLNHFAVACLSKASKGKHMKQKTCNIVEIDTDDDDELFVGMITGSNHKYMDVNNVNNVGNSDWIETVKVNEHPVTFQLDTGAKCNVLSHRLYKQLSSETLQSCKTPLRSYSGHQITCLGTTHMLCSYNNKPQQRVKFYVVDIDSQAVLGAGTCQELGLVKRIYTINHEKPNVPDGIDAGYEDLFSGLGCLPGEHTIKLDHSVTPVVHPPRRVPIALRDKLKDELDRMENLGVIVKQEDPTAWVNSLVTVLKPNGKLRVCIDPSDLNRAIQREHFPLKTVEEVVSRMPGAKIFSKLDLTSGFWQLKLDEESSKLCTFNTPFGRYRFTRLPFGVKSAPEVFQRVISEMVSDLEGTEAIIDDILIWGTTKEEHDIRLKKVLERARQWNVKLGLDKCEIGQTQVTYVGHLLTQDGVKPDPEKVRAVQNMTKPTNVKELQTLMGFVQYLHKFMPRLAEVSGPLRILLEKETAWHWGSEQEKTFNTLVNMVSSAPALQYYDGNKPLTLSVDASSKGLGAVLIQNDKPVAYASRALTATQQRYSQIEKETLAIVYGCTKFHDYVYARHIKVESDHRPLQAIFKKPILQTPPRLQRLLLAMQRYDVEVIYKPGKLMFLADHLSRAYLNETKEVLVPELQVNDIHLTAYLPVSPEKYQQLKEATAKDEDLQILQDIVLEGWPEDKADVPPELRPYWTFRDEISCIDGLMYKSHKLIVPRVLKNTMLELIHQSHLGVVKNKNRARDVLFWLGMSRDIEDMVNQCSICAKHGKSNTKEPMIAMELPTRPWSKIGMDLFEYNNNTYLLTVDYFSKWPEIAKLETTTAKCVITHVKSQMAKYGIPDVVVSDNGPQFACHEFKEFTRQYQFEHVTTSPYYPQSNGQTERMVQTIKNLLKKSNDPYLALLEYRNTQIDGVGLSPAQMFLGRRLKTTIPTALPLLKSDTFNKVHEQLVKRQGKQQDGYNRHALSERLKPLSPGDKVMVKKTNNTSEWTPGTVTDLYKSPRSYLVKSGNRTYRRNRRHLRPTGSRVDLNPEPTDCEQYWPPSIKSKETPSAKPKETTSAKLKEITPAKPNQQLNANQHTSANLSCQIPSTPDRQTTRSSSGRLLRTPAWLKDCVK